MRRYSINFRDSAFYLVPVNKQAEFDNWTDANKASNEGLDMPEDVFMLETPENITFEAPEFETIDF